MRCDGVVEYCYEYFGEELMSYQGHWDISNSRDCNPWHSIAYGMTPRVQASELSAYSYDPYW